MKKKQTILITARRRMRSRTSFYVVISFLSYYFCKTKKCLSFRMPLITAIYNEILNNCNSNLINDWKDYMTYHSLFSQRNVFYNKVKVNKQQ